MTHRRSETGFTLVELLVVMGILSVVSIGFYSLLFASQRSATTGQDISQVSQEARLGLNRMIRDTREAGSLSSPTSTGYQIEIDFDGDGLIEAAEFEVVQFAYDAAPPGRITISNGTVEETLIEGVSPIAGQAMFSYASNRLEFDSNNDGRTTVDELDAAQTAGATLTTDKSAYLSNVSYAFRITKGTSATDFYTQAQLRNRR